MQIRGLIRTGAALVLLAPLGTGGQAGEGDRDHAFPVGEQAALFRERPAMPPARLALAAAEVWTRGLASDAPSLAPERAVGMSLRPLREAGLAIGWEVHRPAQAGAVAHSDVTWRYTWERHRGPDAQPGAVLLGLTAGGLFSVLEPAITQGLATYVGLVLPAILPWSTAELRLAPEVRFDALARAWTLAATPELRAETVLSAPAAPLRSAVNLRLGYRVEPEAKPSLGAFVEWKLSPTP
jgi:hypothetical protein